LFPLSDKGLAAKLVGDKWEVIDKDVGNEAQTHQPPAIWLGRPFHISRLSRVRVIP